MTAAGPAVVTTVYHVQCTFCNQRMQVHGTAATVGGQAKAQAARCRTDVPATPPQPIESCISLNVKQDSIEAP